MKSLNSVLCDVDIKKIWGDLHIQISGLELDSRKIKSNNCFIAINGFEKRGIDFAQQAVLNGANSVVSENSPGENFEDITWIQVKNDRMALSKMAANYFSNPAERLTIIGVTGTNGKTTVVSLINHILNEKENTAKIGTLGMDYQPNVSESGISIKTSLTTPEATDIFSFLSRVEKAGCQNVVMEVSSVALKLARVENIEFSQGLFTTFSGDHLDFHRTMDEYFDSKLRLFRGLSSESTAILNADDKKTEEIIKQLRCPHLTYGFSTSADIKPLKYEFSLDGIKAVIQTPKGQFEIDCALIGRVNLLNILAAIGSAMIKDIPFDSISHALTKIEPVKGRLDFSYRNDFSVLIDYAHTDKALETLLISLKEIVIGRLILVFGAGGSRDKSKRPRMGAVASSYADFILVTSDNPRKENPQIIIDEIISGFQPGFTNVVIEINREKAIQKALQIAAKGDLVVIAGKGHEDYQIFEDKVIHFDDYEVVKRFVQNQNPGGYSTLSRESGTQFNGGKNG